MAKTPQRKWTEEDIRILRECKTLREACERLGRNWAGVSSKRYQLCMPQFPDYRVYRAQYMEARKESQRAKSNSV